MSFPVVSFAESFQAIINASDCKVGDTITVTIDLPQNTEVAGGNFTLTYDYTKMNLKSAEKGPAVDGRYVSVNYATKDTDPPGKIKMIFAGIDENLPLVAGTVLTATFEVISSGTSEFNVKDFKLADINGNALLCESSSLKSITITDGDNSETESSTETSTESETESSTEASTESETESYSEIATESETESSSELGYIITYFEELDSYNQNGVKTNEFEYTDKITIKAKPKTKSNLVFFKYVEPKEEQMALYMGDTQITGAVKADSDGVYTMSIDTRSNCFKLGENIITAKYVGGENSNDCKKDITVIINRKKVVVAGVYAENADYDGTPKKGYTGEPKCSFYNGDYIINYTGRNGLNYNSPDEPTVAGDYRVTFSIPDSSKYTGSTYVDFTINKRGTEFNKGIKVYNENNEEASDFIYGDLIIVEVKPQPTLNLASVRTYNYVEPDKKQMALFMDNEQISGAAADDNGVYRMEIYSNESCFVIGQNIITAKYVGDENSSDYNENVNVYINERELTIGGVVPENASYNGNPQKGYIGEPTSYFYNGKYEVSYTGRNGTIYNSTDAPTEIGDYTVTIRIPESANYYVGETSLDFSILKEKSKFAELKTYNSDNKESKQFAYGDIISVKATPRTEKEASVSLASFAEPTDKQMALYIGNKQISKAASPDKNGVYTMFADTLSDGFVIGQNLITAKYVGDSNTEGCSEDVMILLTKRGVKITGINSVKTAKYSNSAIIGYTGEPTVDVYGGYDGEYEISYSGRNDTVYSSSEAPSEVGDYTVTIKIPENADYYEGETSVDFSVAKKEITISGVSSAGNYDYDGTAKIGYNGTPASEYTGEYEISYSGIGNTSYSGEYAPTEVGQYKVTIKIPDDSNYMGEISFNFEILEQPDDSDDNTNEDNSEETSGETNTEQSSENQTEDNLEETSREAGSEQLSENQTEDNSEETSGDTNTEQPSESQTEDNSEESSGESGTEQPSENGTEQSPDETGTEENSGILIGDVDDNGQLEVNDVSLLLQYVLDKRNILSIKRRENFIEDMDVDGNGQITATDCACILTKVLDNSFVFPIEK